MNTTFIYALIDPTTNEIRYIGKSDNPAKRLKNHFYELNRFVKLNLPLTHKHHWLQKLLNLNLIPKLEILATCKKSEWSNLETQLISDYKNVGFNLTNSATGGLGGGGMTGKKQSLKFLQMLSNRKGKFKHSDETKKLISEQKTGTKLSEEHKRKIGKSHLGLKRSTVAILNMSKAKLGKKMSPEACKNNGKAKIGNSFRANIEWTVSSPDGKIFIFTNLVSFCNDQNIKYPVLLNASYPEKIGKPTTHPKYKGWVVLTKRPVSSVEVQ